MIPLSVPAIRGNEWKYIKECLDTEWVSSAGKFVDKFEENFKIYVGSKNAIACVNGTSALHISCLLAGIKPDDEVIVPTVTFIAPVNVVKYCYAKPIFMDCDDYYNIDVDKTLEFIKEETINKDGFTYNKTTGKRISAIIIVHVFGNAVDINPLLDVCRERNIKIIEDATEALGTVYKKDYLDSKHAGTIGDFGCFSFNGNKIITTGGGGMIITDNAEFAYKAKYLTTQAKDDEVRFIHNEIGYNYRLTNIQAAMGVAQLEQLPVYLKIKKRNFSCYKDKINHIPGLHLAEPPDFAYNNLWMYPLQINKQSYPMDKEGIIRKLTEYGIQTRPLWYLNHLQKQFKEYQNYKIEKAYELYEQTINIPCSINLTQEQIDSVIDTLNIT
jgi:aminotransferase in exopolysaccharide biosynthesis